MYRNKMESSNFFPWKDGVYKFPPLYRFYALKIRGSIGAVKFVMEHDMEISMKTGNYENSDDRGLLASGKAYYNVEVSTSEPGVPKFYAVVYNDGETLTFSDGVSGEWMSEETFNDIKEETDPCDAYPCEYEPTPNSSGKLLWISGLTGTGKSTVSLNIKNKHDYILYEGDCFAAGFNPYVGSAPKAMTPHGTRRLSGISEERKLVCQRFQEESISKCKMGSPISSDICKQFYELMCDDIIKEKLRLGGNWVVNHGLYTKLARDIIKEKLGSIVTLVVLDMSLEDQAKRMTEIALDVSNLSNDDIYDKMLKEKTNQIRIRRKGYEAILKTETNIIEIEITDAMSVDDVSNKIMNLIDF